MFFQAGCDGKNVEVENNILRIEVELPGENLKCTM
jgi:hypothetical protein